MTADLSDNQRQHMELDRAFRAGDLDAVRDALGDPADFPNCQLPGSLGDHPLVYALYWSPLAFIETLLQLGADANYADDDGFPSLIAVLSTDRDDRYALIERLLTAGAAIDQRGLNDWTPLHYAVSLRDLEAVRLLLSLGADPTLETRIDDYTTPLEDAKAIGFTEAIDILQQAQSTFKQTGDDFGQKA